MVDYRQWAYRELKRQGFTVFAPYKSLSGECVVATKDCQDHLRKLRIKGSRSYHDFPSGWYQLPEDHLKKSIGVIDFWVFVSSRSAPNLGRPQPVFLIIPTSDLIEKLKQYATPDSNGTYHLYLQWDEPDHKGMVIERRIEEPWPIKSGSARDYSCYAENWTLIKENSSL